ncbi:MAG: hypothetical protein V1735_04780 [Nanoarchaeota archaeon]
MPGVKATFLDGLVAAREPFVYGFPALLLVREQPPGQDYVRFGRQRLALVETEPVASLETKVLVEQQDWIEERFLTLLSQHKGVETSPEAALFRFMAEQVFPRYNGSEPRKAEPAKEMSMPSGESLLRSGIGFSAMCDHYPAIFLAGRFFTLSGKASSGIEVCFRRASYGLRHLAEAKDIREKYRQRFWQAVDHILLQDFVLPQAPGSSFATAPINSGGLSFRKQGQDYRLSLALGRFICKIRGHFYAFDPVEVGMDISFKGGMLTATKPKVFDAGYHHPFVFSHGGICCNNTYRRHTELIVSMGEFNRGYPLSHPGLAAALADATTRAEQVMRMGYLPSVKAPVNPIDKFIPLPVANLVQAEAYARRLGISAIHDNDNSAGGSR